MYSLYRLTSSRQLINDREVKVSIQGHGQCTRDRRSGHHQYVRWNMGVLTPELSTLRYTEAMLFINYYQTKVFEFYFFFQQCMSADYNMQGAVFKLFVNFSALFGFSRTGKLTNIQSEFVG